MTHISGRLDLAVLSPAERGGDGFALFLEADVDTLPWFTCRCDVDGIRNSSSDSAWVLRFGMLHRGPAREEQEITEIVSCSERCKTQRKFEIEPVVAAGNKSTHV